MAESFKPRTTSEEQQPRSSYTDNGLDRSLARTGSSKVETIWNNTEREIATIGKAGPIETKEPVAMADVAEPLPSLWAGGPVVARTQFTAVADRTGASGLGRSETGEPVVVETQIQTEIAVAVASGPAVTGAGDSVGVETGLPRPVARLEPELVVRSWSGTGSWPLQMYMPCLKTERMTHRATSGNLNWSQELSRK